jgi:hypothetical protein
MSRDFQIIQLDLDPEAFKRLPNRQRNQLVGCMHAHNELVVLNRLLMFSLNDVGDGELHNDAQGVQMWTILQVLTGKLFETWDLIAERFLGSNPEDSGITGLSEAHKKSLDWLRDYFGDEQGKKRTQLRTLRDKTAFHYDKLNLDQAVNDVSQPECRVYIAEHPANAVYYAGSALIFRTVFAMIANQAMDTKAMSGIDRMAAGVRIALADVNRANFHLHTILYGLIAPLLDRANGKPTEEIEQLRIPVVGAPKPTMVGLPMFIDVGPEETAP